MESSQLPSLEALWTVAAVLVGFQVTALSWRLSREIQMEARGERTWLTLPDLLVTASFLLLVVGVFVAPIAGAVAPELAAKLLGVAMLVFAASPFVLAGHYNLYRDWDRTKSRPQVTGQELVAAIVVILPVGAGSFWILA